MVEAVGAIGKVREGRDGRLFLGRQDGFDLDMFAGGMKPAEETISFWRRAITRRGAELAGRGVPYVFFIVPDAPSVYPEDLPDGLNTNFTPPGQMFVDAMGDIPNVTFVYPLATLRGAKGGIDIYKKKDSHWTTFGSFVGYQSLMDSLAGRARFDRLSATDVQFRFRRSYGDLGSLMSPEQAEDIPIVTISGPEPAIARQLDGVNRQTATESTFDTGSAGSRALFFRDSFMTDLAPYLARSFPALLTIGSTMRVMLDAVDDWKADIVVSQIAERKLVFFESDHQLEGYETVYKTDYRSAEGRRLLQARIVLPEDPKAALGMIADDMEAYSNNPAQAFSAAIIHEANGLIAAADALVHRCLQAQPGTGSYLALAGRCALGLGRPLDAVRWARAAVERCGYNGYYHELYVYALLQSHQSTAARQVVEDAIDHIHDHPNLWYMAAVLHAGGCVCEPALSYINEALRLDPCNQVYLELRDRVAKLGQ